VHELAEEIELAIEGLTYVNFPIYCSTRGVLVDAIWRYKDMWNRLRVLARRLGLPEPVEPPRAKGEFRKDRRPAREVLSKSQRDRVYAAARVEFDLLGFKR